MDRPERGSVATVRASLTNRAILLPRSVGLGRLRLTVHNHVFKFEICNARSGELVLLKHYVKILEENIADLRLTGIWLDRAEGCEVTLDADEAQVTNHGLGRRFALEIRELRPRLNG